MKRLSIFAASLIFSMMLSAQTRETAVLFSGMNLDDSYLLADDVSVAFDNSGNAAIYTGTSKVSELDITKDVTAEFKDAFKLKANQDPDHQENYYSTFFTSERAYKVPTDGSVKAYAGVVNDEQLNMTNIGSIIHQREPVILKANQSDIILMPSCNTRKASIENILKGIDEKTTLKEGDYAMTLGQNGVGFYKWANKQLGANKAYMTLDDEDDEKTNAFTFLFNDGTTTGIRRASSKSSPEGKDCYGLNGMRVNGKYGGVIIKNGKKVFVK